MTRKIVHIPEHRQVSSTPSNPQIGYQKIYAKTDRNWYGLDELGNETLLGGSSYSGTIGTFVYRPNGGVNSGIVYDDFELLMIDLEAWPGQKYLWFDASALPSPSTPIEIPVRGSGAWDFSDTHFGSLLSTYSGINASFTELQILDGNTWSNFPVSIVFVTLSFYNTADPVYTISDGGTYITSLVNAATLQNYGSIEAIRVENASHLIIGTQIGDIKYDSYEIFNLLDTSELTISMLEGGDVNADIVRGEVGTTFDINVDSPKGQFWESQSNFLGTLNRGYGPISIIMNDTLPNLNTVTLRHYFNSYNLSVEVWEDKTGVSGGYTRLGETSITVDMPDPDNVVITDHLGLGGILLHVIIKNNKSQIIV